VLFGGAWISISYLVGFGYGNFGLWTFGGWQAARKGVLWILVDVTSLIVDYKDLQDELKVVVSIPHPTTPVC
jgi:hypothetical protein